MSRLRAMHYAVLDTPHAQNAILVSGQVQGYGCEIAERAEERGARVDATPFVRYVTCKACQRFAAGVE